ncbi:unnamed protein product [Phaeothamnion confervicola]
MLAKRFISHSCGCLGQRTIRVASRWAHARLGGHLSASLSSSSMSDVQKLASALLVKRGRRRSGDLEELPEELVTRFCEGYSALPKDERERLLLFLARHLGMPPAEAVVAAADRFKAAVDIAGAAGSAATSGTAHQRSPRSSRTETAAAYTRLREETAPLSDALFTQIVALSDAGVEFLVALRADLVATIYRHSGGAAAAAAPAGAATGPRPAAAATDLPALRALDRGLRALLQGWFSMGFLELRRITFEKSGGAVLEKIARYEAVYAFTSLAELKARLGAGRRCFAFFHPCLPDEPLVFVHVALLPRLPAALTDIAAGTAPAGAAAAARVAAFYSISATQRGLSGVQLGHSLIRRVVASLRADLPRLETFATLSPVPGLQAWLAATVARRSTLGAGNRLAGEPLLRPAEAAAVAEMLAARGSGSGGGKSAGTGGEEAGLMGNKSDGDGADLLRLLDGPWHEDTATAARLRPIVLRLAAAYLLGLRRRDRVMDPVGNFHISNGASVERLNWLADPSPKGLSQSFGVMVNYLYRADRIAENGRAYATRGEVAAARRVVALLAADSGGESGTVMVAAAATAAEAAEAALPPTRMYDDDVEEE